MEHIVIYLIQYYDCSSCADFWSFCWHEGGIHDYSAIIDYVLEETEKENLFFVGHSMGSTQYLVSLNQFTEILIVWSNSS